MRATLPLLLLVACFGGRDTSSATPVPEASLAKAIRFEEDPELAGLRVTLREAQPPAPGDASLPRPRTEPLSQADLDRVLARLPALEEAHGDRQTFALRPGSAPPPVTGADVQVPFPAPPAGEAPEVTTGPLTVSRHAPEGEVPMAPHLSLTFDQPMIAVTSQAEAAKRVPVKLTPQPAGQWRWLGTRTLMFDPDPRFPMATEYTVEVPAGTESATGGKLAKPFTFTFATPAPVVQSWWPSEGPHRTDPVVVVVFDQAVDAAAVAPHVELTSPKGAHALVLAAEADIERDEAARAAIAAAEPGRWVALRPAEPLPKDTSFSLTVKEGAPSAEGPRTTPSEQGDAFYTYAPLAVEESRCAWGYEACPPTAPWYVRFNNPLDADAFDESAWKVDPPVTNLSFQPQGEWIYVYGAFQGRTTYTLTAPAGLTDTFGQTLGKDRRLTFQVGPAEPSLQGPNQPVVVLDPGAAPTLSVFSTNHPSLQVDVHRVGPEHWDDWVAYLRKYQWDDIKPGKLPGARVFSGAVAVTGPKDTLNETTIDLSAYADGGVGQFVIKVEPTVQPADRWNRQYVFTWVQATKIGLTAFADGHRLVGWANELGTGASIEGATLEILPDGAKATTGADGLAAIPLGDSEAPHKLLVARRGDDVAILPEVPSAWGDYTQWKKASDLDALRWYVFDDRGLYRPGDDVRVKGWLRLWERGPGGGVAALGDKPSELSWVLTSAMGDELGKGKATVSGLGGFELDLRVPVDANLGTAQLQLTAVDAGDLGTTHHSHPLEIQEFRRPEFEVTASATEGPYLLGAEAGVTLKAAYYAGGGLPNAPVEWSVYAEPASFVPPNRSGFSFGTWSPWWSPWTPEASWEPLATLSGTTDAAGEHTVALHFEAMNPPRPYSVRAEATTYDVNRQAWTAQSAMLLHPSDVYVGVRAEKAFVDKGEDIVIDTILVDLDGEAVVGAEIALRFHRLEWGRSGGEWKEQIKDERTCAVTSAAEAASCTFTPEVGGSWRVVATAKDSLGRQNQTEHRVWVSGEETRPARQVELEALTLVPEGQDYVAGDTARILVQAPFSPAEGTITLRRDGLLETRRFRMDGPTTTIEVPLLEEHVPNLRVQVDLVGQASRVDDDGKKRDDLPKRVAHASGSLDFVLKPIGKTLAVTVTPREAATKPGGETTIDLLVVDAAGAPVPDAELAVVVADESVLALTGYRVPDPLDLFWAARWGHVADHRLRAHVELADPLALAAAGPPAEGLLGGEVGDVMQPQSGLGGLGMRGTGSGGGGSGYGAGIGGAEKSVETVSRRSAVSEDREFEPMMEAKLAAPDMAAAPVAMRADFSALALFAPDVRTDSQGRASVPLKLPDSLTRYRIMVVAAAGADRFGQGESTVTARLPLMVRPSAPRFLNFGDQMELPIVVQNQTDAEMVVDVAVRATNLTFVAAVGDVLPDAPDAPWTAAGQRVRVPANDRVEVRFPAAALMAGTARFQAVAASGQDSDAATLSLPVWTPATTEAFATYGEIDDGAIVQPVEAPPDVWTQFGGLEVSTSSTQLQALTDAVLYLQSYPYECNEQIGSRVLALSALRDVLGAFESEDLPPAEALRASVAGDLERLRARQNGDGGWAFWRRGDESWPYLTIHVAHALARAEAKDYAVDPEMRAGALRYLRTIEQHIPGWYSKEARWFLRAYTLDVRRRMGDADVAEARRLYKQAGLKGLGIEGLAWLLPTFHDAGGAEVAEIVRHLENNTTETAGTAHFVTSYADGEQVLLHSDRRADGIVLEALIEVKPSSDLVAKVTRGLLAHRTQGRWGNTQENAFVLLAMDRYFHVYEGETPDFVARVWLGDGYAGDHTFAGRTTETAHHDVPMGWLSETDGAQRLTIGKDGDDGRLYYRVGLKYAPKDLRLEAADHGFAVERVYEAIDDPKDVTRGEDGIWRIRAGSRVRVRVTMVAEARRYHVALVDPIPAGLEAQNPELATTGTLPQDPDTAKQPWWFWWDRTWYEHENLRDERAEAFASLLWDGVHEYSYVALATTPGRFVVPPSKAEEMYHPETFGRGATDIVIVE